jgi:hypothetical protein
LGSSLPGLDLTDGDLVDGLNRPERIARKLLQHCVGEGR